MPSTVETQLVEKVKLLYRERSASTHQHKEASDWLLDFRKRDNAWNVCFVLLTKPGDQSEVFDEQDVLFFAAHSLNALACQTSSTDRFHDVIRCIEVQKNASAPVITQLCSAVAATIIWKFVCGPATQEIDPFELLAPLRDDPSLVKCGIQCFAELAELLCSKRFALDSQTARSVMQNRLLPLSLTLFNFTHQACQTLGNEDVNITIACAKLLDTWTRMTFSLARHDPQAIAREIRRWVDESSIISDLSEWLCNPYVAKYAREPFMLIAESTSTQELFDMQVAVSLLQALVQCTMVSQRHMPPYTDDEVVKSCLICLSVFASYLLPAILFDDRGPASSDGRSLLGFGLTCLQFGDLEIQQLALDSYYALLGHHIALVDECKRDPSLTDTVMARETVLRPLLLPLVDHIFKHAMAFPSVPDMNYETFDFEAWFKYRDLCTLLLTDATVVVDYDVILGLAGGELQQWVNTANRDEDALIPWNRIEACLFALTCVAPRAPAGKDYYIPLALTILPQLNYPDDPIEGLVLRAAASRLILWTAGYVGTQKQLFLDLYDLSEKSLCFACDCKRKVEGGNMANYSFLRYAKHVETSIVETIVSICTAASIIRNSTVDADSHHLTSADFHKVLRSLPRLLAHEASSISCRCSLLLAFGTVVGCLEADARDRILNSLIQGLFGAYQEAEKLHGSADRLTCEAAKLTLVAIECLKTREQELQNHNKIQVSTDQDVDSTPLLGVLKRCWKMLETIVDQAGSQDSVAESVSQCLDHILSQSRWVVCQNSLLQESAQLICRAFTAFRSVYYVNSLRNIMRIFSRIPLPTVHSAQKLVLTVIGDATLEALQSDNIRSNQPDLLGMLLDTLSVSLTSPMSSRTYLTLTPVATTLKLALKSMEALQHPKVHLTLGLLLRRMIAWAAPDDHVKDMPNNLKSHFQLAPSLLDEISQAWSSAVEFCQEQLVQVLKTDQTVEDVIYILLKSTVTNRLDSIEWLDTAAAILIKLKYCEEIRQSVTALLEGQADNKVRQLLSQYMNEDKTAALCTKLRDAQSQRILCDILKDLAGESQMYHAEIVV